MAMLLLTCILLYTHDQKTHNVLAVKQSSGNTLIESTNDAQVDAAINEEILKSKGKEEAESNGDVQPVAQAEGTSDEQYDVAKEYREIRALAPMTIFSKTYCPFSKALKKLLQDSYNIVPPPTIVELDKSKHGKELQEFLEQITGRRTVPNVLVGASSSESQGGADDFIDMHKKGELETFLNSWGEKKLLVTKKETPSNV